MELKKSPKADLEKKKSIFIQIGLIISLGLVLAAFEYKTSSKENNELLALNKETVEEEVIPVTRQEVATPPPPQPQVTELNIVKDDQEIKEELEMENMDADANTKMEIRDIVVNEEEQVQESEVFFIVEDMPKFMGGSPDVEFRNYIAKNLKYPAIAAENGISGRVFIQFVVNEKGEVTNAKVVRSVDPSLDEEALRIIRSSPRWTPGKQRGKPVKVAFTFQVNFVLQ
jgi:protein TonB